MSLYQRIKKQLTLSTCNITATLNINQNINDKDWNKIIHTTQNQAFLKNIPHKINHHVPTRNCQSSQIHIENFGKHINSQLAALDTDIMFEKYDNNVQDTEGNYRTDSTFYQYQIKIYCQGGYGDINDILKNIQFNVLNMFHLINNNQRSIDIHLEFNTAIDNVGTNLLCTKTTINDQLIPEGFNHFRNLIQNSPLQDKYKKEE